MLGEIDEMFERVDEGMTTHADAARLAGLLVVLPLATFFLGLIIAFLLR